ncbi:MAG: dicarboxylate/amino acid:cation symporter [Pseudomonadota bacterium]|uniref:dicarboxylate/amino acid:cation symporter n=1 Tax=Gallaecimonas pentaromativorans TaxID=584787 RepID=UPI00067EE812|nr:dicarboxylate/amino acid:cation symporter [Gallaecimonas pentaromativorans]MED5523809.1 dicarboxylate/amino acid:cation symporter [Pseudomonadota bacterium]
MQSSLTTRIFVALAAGLIFGTLSRVFFADVDFIHQTLIHDLFGTAGGLFVSLIKLMVVPLVFISIVNGVCSLENLGQFGRLGTKTFLLYLVNTVLAIAVALTLALWLAPGEGAGLTLNGQPFTPSFTEPPSLLQLVASVVPSNPFKAFVDGNMLQILFMAIITGIAIKGLGGEETRAAARGFAIANKVMMKLVVMVMSLAPLGVLFLTTGLAATLDTRSIAAVGSYVGSNIAIMLLWMLVFYPMVVSVFTGISPWLYLAKLREQIFFSLSTASSNATIPVTFKTLTEKLGVDKTVAGFGVPLGATMNMSGSAIYMTVATIFVANAYGAGLDASQMVALATTTFMLAIATGGVPGGAAVMTGVLLHQLGLPMEAVAIILATDRICDAFVTATNVVGDTAVSTLVAKTEGSICHNALKSTDNILVEG